MAVTLSDILTSSQAERLATGFVFTEGPVWHPDGYLLFVDIRRRSRWYESGYRGAGLLHRTGRLLGL